MKIEANVWQTVPGTAYVELFPIIPRATAVSSNCYILSAPAALVVVDPGANAEQTRQISRVVTEALAVSPRPVLVFLTHCHQDHSQEAGAFVVPTGVRVTRFAHRAGVKALETGDRNLTVAYLYPWHPEICSAPFEGVLFASIPASATPGRERADAGLGLNTATIAMPDGTMLEPQWLSIGDGTHAGTGRRLDGRPRGQPSANTVRATRRAIVIVVSMGFVPSAVGNSEASAT